AIRFWILENGGSPTVAAWAAGLSIAALIAIGLALEAAGLGLDLTVFGAPTRLGRSTPSVEQFYLLAGTNFYNPSWGWQDGKKRNANVNEFHTPVIILSHEWKIKDNITLETTGSFLFGTNNSSALDWNNAPDPRPDFYRYLPTFIEDSALRVEAFNLYANNKDLMQINWDRMYQANRASLETIQDADGIPGNQVTGKRARYIVEDRVIDNKRATFYTNYNHSIGIFILLQVYLFHPVCPLPFQNLWVFGFFKKKPETEYSRRKN
ncbi:MAG: hypothetical protein EBX50_16395, partial [Chitinophagia bacterium]|nr:hypothetical protein [Chitinophagia bacterium]